MIEYFLLAFFASQPAAAVVPASTVSPTPAPVQAKKAPALKESVDISAQRFEVQGRRKEAVLSGNVVAVRGSTTLRCDRAIAEYSDGREIRRVQCSDNVEATDGDRWAHGEHAVFDNVSGTLTVTGTPKARQGSTFMEGSKVTLETNRDVTTVVDATIVAAGASSSGPAGLETVISADHFELQARRRRAVLTGNVKAIKGPTTLTCDRAIAIYSDRQQLKRLECAGRVQAVDGDKWASGQRAEFDVIRERLSLTGKPQARQGGSVLEGTKVTFFSGRDLMVVDDARAVLEDVKAPAAAGGRR
ncbi:MAG: LptA/OstA family protein [Myxococcaceae bacterium]